LTGGGQGVTAGPTLKPSRGAPLNFGPGTRSSPRPRRTGSSCSAPTWSGTRAWGRAGPEGELFELSEQEAREILSGTLEATVSRYRGRMAGWIIVNEIVANSEDPAVGLAAAGASRRSASASAVSIPFGSG
jgi:hypothetical protein